MPACLERAVCAVKAVSSDPLWKTLADDRMNESENFGAAEKKAAPAKGTITGMDRNESATVKALTISCSAAHCEVEQVLEIKGDEDFAAIWRSWVTPQIRRRT